MEKDSSSLLREAAITGDLVKVEALLAAGVYPSIFDADGMTPLMHAALHGHSAAVRRLIEAGAPWTALHFWVLRRRSRHGAWPPGSLRRSSRRRTSSQLVLGTIVRSDSDRKNEYLDDGVSFSEDKVMDSRSMAMIMAWEGLLMEAHARAVCGNENGGRILNSFHCHFLFLFDNSLNVMMLISIAEEMIEKEEEEMVEKWVGEEDADVAASMSIFDPPGLPC